MSIVPPDVTYVAGVEIHCEHIGSRIEHPHAPFALDVILPFVRIWMPMHLPQRAGPHRNKRCSNGHGNLEIVAVGELHLSAFRVADWCRRSERERERVR